MKQSPLQKAAALAGNISPLERNMAEKIAAIKDVEKEFPGAIIIHNLQDSTVVYMSKWGRDYLGVTNEELQQMGIDYHNRFFNPEDVKDYGPKIFDLLARNNDDEFVAYFQEVRRSPQHEWRWYLSATRIFFRNEMGNPLLTLTTALPVDAQHLIAAKAQRLLEENNFLRQNHHAFDQLTKREKEILRLMAMGVSSEEMAQQLHISETTASTHRRNVKRKLKIANNYDTIRFAQAFGLI